MMLRIGNSFVVRHALCVMRKTQSIKRKAQVGFTLIEVMIATAVLSLGTVLIYEAFFISLDSFNYYSNYLSVIPWMDEKIWQAQDDLSKFGALAQIGTTDEFQKAGKAFRWNLNYSPIDDGLYRIDLNLYWQEGQRKIKLLRTAYALYEQKQR